MTEDEMVGRHHRLNGCQFEQTPGNCEGQGGLVCYNPWRSQRVRHDLATEQQTQESNATADLAAGKTQAEVPAMGRSYKYRGSFA